MRLLPASHCLVWIVVGIANHVLAMEPELPPGPLGEVVRLGETLVSETATHPLTKPYVGNSLNCTSCHLDNGRHETAGSFLGAATAYPAWSPREKRAITLEDRILNCFMRSCNGTRPPLGSQPSVAIATYITWLSQGEPLRMNADRPTGPRAVRQLKLDVNDADRSRGAEIYSNRCADCHGEDGQGDEYSPPLWGTNSYNDGAGLADVVKLASWLKPAMPLDDADLTDQEALDVAAYVNSHDRPVFILKNHLPPDSSLGEYNGDEQGD